MESQFRKILPNTSNIINPRRKLLEKKSINEQKFLINQNGIVVDR